MTTDLYDQISPPLVEQVKQQPEFVLHVAFVGSQGFCVAEIWIRRSSTTPSSRRTSRRTFPPRSRRRSFSSTSRSSP